MIASKKKLATGFLLMASFACVFILIFMRQDINLLDDDSGSRQRTFPKGTLLYKEGQRTDAAFLIKQGRVALYQVINNKRVGLGVRGPGDMSSTARRSVVPVKALESSGTTKRPASSTIQIFSVAPSAKNPLSS